VQNADQSSTIDVTSKSSGNGLPSKKSLSWSFPINIALTQTYDPNTGNISQVTTSKQTHTAAALAWDWFWPTGGYANNVVYSTDNLLLVPEDGGYGVGGNSDQASYQTYTADATDGYCYYQKVAATDNLLSSTKSVPWCSSEPANDATAVKTTAASETAATSKRPSTTLIGPLVRKAAAANKSK
jgi:hypothetical protein